jgi:Uma2 family endonuclease
MTAVETSLPSAAEELFTLDDVSWELYERMRDEPGLRNIRMTYDEGRLVLMSPLPKHERLKRLIGRLVEAMSEERDIPIGSLGSTTWKRKQLRKGLEADECYYVQHEPQIRSRLDIDLRRDPPPDLAIEVEVTHHPVDRLEVYAKLKVPEVWNFDGRRIVFLGLGPENQYHPIDRSEAFPFLSPVELQRFIDKFGTIDETSVIREFRKWVRTIPRDK